jgi:hypothetical protein
MSYSEAVLAAFPKVESPGPGEFVAVHKTNNYYVFIQIIKVRDRIKVQTAYIG